MSSQDLPPAYTRFQDTPPCYDPDKAKADFDALSSDQKANLSKGIAQASSRDDALPHFKEAANAAAKAVDKIDTMFVTLTAKLISLGDTQKFVDDFGTIKQHYRSVVTDSHELAISISNYAESFDLIIVKFCADQTLTVERRIEQINDYIAEGDGIKTKAENMESRFNDLKDEFSTFVGSFSTWAKAREEADEKKIKDLYKEIAEIDKQITAIETAMKVIGAALAATLPATGILALLFPPAAPFILGIGCAIAGVELASLTGLAIARNILLNDKRTKELQITDLQDEISKIKAARTQLEETGQADLLIFTTNITAIAKVWSHVQNDADDIRGWLKKGAKLADQPDYMKIALQQGVAVYTTMAKYLKDYANGVTETVRSFKVQASS